ncbi:hypothetical protein OFB82_27035, partial [Escherichia coli]|nr:hypothetical protein [Escherichia coli]
MTSLKTSIKTITYLSDIGCLEIQGASLILISSVRIVHAMNKGKVMKHKLSAILMAFMLTTPAA